MATLKSMSAVTRSHVLATVRVWQSAVFDCATRKLYHPGSVLGRVRHESLKTVCRSSSDLRQHHQMGHNQPESRILHSNSNMLRASPRISNMLRAFPRISNTDAYQYICPSRLGQLFSQLVIMDDVSNVHKHYDCPLPDTLNISKISPVSQNGKPEISEAPDVRRTTDSKEAKEIMRIRHKKMKKHKLRKLRKRMYFLWRKQKATRKAKRLAIYWKEISDIKKEAEDFSAEDFVKEQLEKARKGGFYIKVMDSKV